jgi:YegS/Rv2252/BmrU family lipid kinase
MSYAFIFNPASGSKKDPSFFEKLIIQFCQEKKLEYVLWKTERPGHGRILAQEALRKGFPCIVAIGGDGTINEIGGELIHTQVSLGIIPKGSANGFAREFGIPLNPRKAFDTLLQSKTLAVDVGRINEELFFSVAGVGFDARVGYTYNQTQKGGRRGKIPYFTSAIREYLAYAPPAMSLRFEEKERRLSPFLIAIANSRQYGIGALIAPKAVVNDGLLNLSIVHQAPLYQYLWFLPKVFTGTIDRAPFFENIAIKEATLSSEKELLYHIDGEFRFGETKLVAKIEPASLMVKVPRPYRA